MNGCQHPDFVASADVNRLSSEEGGPISAFALDLRVRCAACDEPFEFVGLAAGLSPREPLVSMDRLEAHLPIRPVTAPPDWGLDGPGYTVSVHRPEEPGAN